MVAASLLAAAIIIAVIAIVDYSTDITFVGPVSKAQKAMGHSYSGPALWANGIVGRAPQADDHPVPQLPPPTEDARCVFRAHETYATSNLYNEVLAAARSNAAADRTPAPTPAACPAGKPDACGRGEAPTPADIEALFRPRGLRIQDAFSAATVSLG